MSQTAVSEKGTIIKFPENFNNLPEKKQKKVALETVSEIRVMLSDLYTENLTTADEIKNLSRLISQSTQMKLLKKLKTAGREKKKRMEELGYELEGMKRILKKLGIDITKELAEMKMIEG